MPKSQAAGLPGNNALDRHSTGTSPAPVTAVPIWTGRLATALQAATRMSQEAFALHLGISVRAVRKWQENPEIELRMSSGEMLDTVLNRLDDVTRQRFSLLVAPSATALATTGSAQGERPSPDAVVAASQERWREVRSYITENGLDLARRTADLYPEVLRVGDVPALTTPAWVPPEPIPLESVSLQWEKDAPAPTIIGQEAEARSTLPLRAPGQAFARYTSAIRYLKPPALFENRHSYRLLDADLAGRRLTFGLSTFFDKLDVSEALGHESAQASMAGSLDWPQLPFRSAIQDPFDLAARPVNPGISTLTIRREADGSATFFLLARNPDLVTNGRHYSLLPAGEFQPASIATQSISSDLDLWRNIVRESSEEMLGQPEHDGSSGTPVDYETWPFYRDMSRARKTGELRVYLLGIVLDSLSLNASIATVAVFDASTFDVLFKRMVAENAEGVLVAGKSLIGLPFDHSTVQRFTTTEPLGQTSAACLSMAWAARHVLS